MPNISYQLYCSRNFPPLSDTLRMLADAGFKEVEGYGGLLEDSAGLKDAIAETGLHMSSCHVGLDMLEAEPQAVLDLASHFRMRAIFAPFLMPQDRPTDAAGWSAFGGQLADIGKPFEAAGVAFGWHNHDFELMPAETGEMPLDLMMAAAPDLKLELDLGWVIRANQDPVSWIQKYADRIAAVHVKDVAAHGENASEDGWADVGHGTVDWVAIHEALQSAGINHYVVEHDNPSDHHRFASRSLTTIQNL